MSRDVESSEDGVNSRSVGVHRWKPSIRKERVDSRPLQQPKIQCSHTLQQLTLQAAALSLPDGVVFQLLSVNNQGVRLLDRLPAEAATQLGPIAQQESAG